MPSASSHNLHMRVLAAAGAWGALALPATMAREIDVRTPVVCMHLGAVAVDTDGLAEGLYWPAHPDRTAIFAPVRTIFGSAAIGTAPDPDDPARRIGLCAVTAPDSYGRMRYRVSDGIVDATRETPESFWFEATFEYDFEGSLTTAGEIIRFLEFSDASGARIVVRLQGGQEASWQVVNVAGHILPGAQTLLAGPVPQTGTKYALRMHWDVGPGPDADGTLRFVTVDLDAGLVLHDTTIQDCANGEFGGFAVCSGIAGPELTSAQFRWDHVTYSAISPPASMTAPGAWASAHRLPGPAVGAQRTSADDGSRIELRVATVWPDGDLGARKGAASALVGFEYREDGDPEWTGSGIAHDVRTSDFGFASETLAGLKSLAKYEVRAVYTRDGGGPAYSQTSRVRTLSARDSAPGTLRLGSYSCISAKAAPTYAPSVLARREANEVQCLGDFSYTNVDMGYQRPSDYLAFGPFEERRLEWNRLFLLQLLSPTVASGTHGVASHWMMLDDHLFRDDLAGARDVYKSGDGLIMIEEIGGFVEDTVCRLSFPVDGGNTVRRYWWTRETARTLSLFLECRQAADHGQGRSPVLPLDKRESPWDGRVGEGDRPLIPANTSTWGTTLLGAAQTAHMIGAVRSTAKPIVVVHSPVMVANGSQREYQDLGTYPEIWDILQACEDNPAIMAVVILSGDLHLAMVVPGANVPSPARMHALGKAAQYPKLLWEAMIGGGGQGGHRLRWQIGNDEDADSGLRAGAWNGASAPRWEYAADYNSRWPGDEVVDCWDYDFTHAVTWDGTEASGISAKQERVAMLTIDEPRLALTLEVIDLQTEKVDYSRTDDMGACDCPADRNHDCLIDTRDVIQYLSEWAAHDPDADLNGDGHVDSRDLLEFLNRWASGC